MFSLLHVLMQFLRKYYKTLLFMSDGTVPVESDCCNWQGNTREGTCLSENLHFHPVNHVMVKVKVSYIRENFVLVSLIYLISSTPFKSVFNYQQTVHTSILRLCTVINNNKSERNNKGGFLRRTILRKYNNLTGISFHTQLVAYRTSKNI